MFVIGAKNNKKLRDFCKFAAPIISRGNSDGFGYIAVKENNQVFTEKWLKNDDAFKGNPLTDADRETISGMKDFIDAPDLNNYHTTGLKNWSQARSILMHARWKTNGGIEIDNTHPFMQDDTFLVHNGMIRNYADFGIKATECDSISLLRQYLANDVANNASNIRDALEPMQGYWAVGVTAMSGDKRVVDIFTSKTATDSRTNTNYGKQNIGGSGTLAMTYVNQLQGYVLATKQDDIEDVLKKLEWKHENKFFGVQEKRMMRFDAVTGEALELVDHSGLTIVDNKNSGGTSSGKSSTTSQTNGTTGTGSQNNAAGNKCGSGNSQQRGSLPSDTSTSSTQAGTNRNLSMVDNSLPDDDLSSTALFFLGNPSYTEIPSSVLQRNRQEESTSAQEELVFEEDDTDTIETELVASDSKYGDVEEGSMILSDSRYPSNLEEIDDEMMDLLDDYAMTLQDWEQREVNELPDDLKYKALLDHYNDQRVS